MITELIGLPGVGKTFLAHNLTTKHDICIINISNNFERYLYGFLFTLLHPITTVSLVKITISETPRQNLQLLKHKLLKPMLKAMAIEQKARLTFGNVIVDEGIFQYITFSIFERRIEKQTLSKLVPKLNLTERSIILVKASNSDHQARIKKRGSFCRDKLGEKYVEEWKQILIDNSKEIERFIIEQPNIKIVVV